VLDGAADAARRQGAVEDESDDRLDEENAAVTKLAL
jgi:hypothetical protein